MTVNEHEIRYWVGSDRGRWNDRACWSTSPGGEPGASVPTAVDDVVFDAYSGYGHPFVVGHVGWRRVLARVPLLGRPWRRPLTVGTVNISDDDRAHVIDW